MIQRAIICLLYMATLDAAQTNPARTSTGKKETCIRAALVRKFYSFQEWHDLRVMPFPATSVHSVG